MWTPVDTTFYAPQLPLEIVDFGGGSEGEALRTILESLDVVVLLHRIGTPSDLLQVLAQGDTCAPHMILSGHGDEGDLILGEYAEGIGIDVSMLHEGRMPPEAIAAHIRLPGCVVINTACEAGLPATARAFMQGGLRAYIAAADALHGTAVPLFIMHFFYALTEQKASLRRAWQHAASYDAHSGAMLLYDRGGCHRLLSGKETPLSLHK